MKEFLQRKAFWRDRIFGPDELQRGLLEGAQACLSRSREVLKRCQPTPRFPPEPRVPGPRPKSTT